MPFFFRRALAEGKFQLSVDDHGRFGSGGEKSYPSITCPQYLQLRACCTHAEVFGPGPGAAEARDQQGAIDDDGCAKLADTGIVESDVQFATSPRHAFSHGQCQLFKTVAEILDFGAMLANYPKDFTFERTSTSGLTKRSLLCILR